MSEKMRFLIILEGGLVRNVVASSNVPLKDVEMYVKDFDTGDGTFEIKDEHGSDCYFSDAFVEPENPKGYLDMEINLLNKRNEEKEKEREAQK